MRIEAGWLSHWRFDMACITLRVGLLLLVALAAGCATTRTGSGSAVSGTNPVTFGWTGRGNVYGSMTATFANGRTFTGEFSQITSNLTHEIGSQGPLWHQEGQYDVGPWLQSVPHYTGRVVANLSGSGGVQMRCRLELARPVDGMAGGAHGECHLPDGLSVDAQFPAD
jgi:hypothetical protein